MLEQAQNRMQRHLDRAKQLESALERGGSKAQGRRGERGARRPGESGR